MSLKDEFYRKSFNNPDNWRMILYSDQILRKKHGSGPEAPYFTDPIIFRLLGLFGTEKYKAEINRNNIGLLSKNQYYHAAGKDQKTILILGGEQTASSVCTLSWPDKLQDILVADQINVRIINLAWPDAGPAHYWEYLEQEGRLFHPDLILVNYTEMDFYRNLLGAQLRFFGRDCKNDNDLIHYKIRDSDKSAFLMARGHVQASESLSLRSKDLCPSRPWGMFLDKEIIFDDSKIDDLQVRVVNDYIKGAWEALPEWIEYRKSMNSKFEFDPAIHDAHDVKQFDNPEEQKIPEDDCVDFVFQYFKKISSLGPPVLYLHNFNMYELENDWNLTKKLIKKDKTISVTDMRESFKASVFVKRPISEYFMFPDMSEKWNEAGHAMYAMLVAKEVKNHLRKL
jgi:hypothetical protein